MYHHRWNLFTKLEQDSREKLKSASKKVILDLYNTRENDQLKSLKIKMWKFS